MKTIAQLIEELKRLPPDAVAEIELLTPTERNRPFFVPVEPYGKILVWKGIHAKMRLDPRKPR